jgi:hypothetical protein
MTQKKATKPFSQRGAIELWETLVPERYRTPEIRHRNLFQWAKHAHLGDVITYFTADQLNEAASLLEQGKVYLYAKRDPESGELIRYARRISSSARRFLDAASAAVRPMREDA